MEFSNEKGFARVFLLAKLRIYKLTLLAKELQNLTTTTIQEPKVRHSTMSNKTNSNMDFEWVIKYITIVLMPFYYSQMLQMESRKAMWKRQCGRVQSEA